MVLSHNCQFPVRFKLLDLKYSFTRPFKVLKNFAESTLEKVNDLFNMSLVFVSLVKYK